MESISAVLVLAAVVVLFILLFKIIAKPIAKILKLLVHAAFGYVLLFLVNFFFGSAGLLLEFNLVNALVAGLGGMPGVILLILYNLFWK